MVLAKNQENGLIPVVSGYTEVRVGRAVADLLASIVLCRANTRGWSFCCLSMDQQDSRAGL